MRILHILDHSVPLHSGYAFRTLSILKQQRALGWHTIQLTGPKQGAAGSGERSIDGWHFFRTAPSGAPWARLPVLNHLALVDALARRVRHVAKLTRPDVLHAHSPSLNALAALRAGRSLGLPVVYEIRAFWEDAAVDHGTSSKNGVRYRLSRALETYAARRVDAVTTICEGLRAEIESRGIARDRITVIPNAVNLRRFGNAEPRDQALARRLGLDDGPVLGFIGSFYAYEGLEVLLEALPLMLQTCPTMRVLLVGGGQQEARLRERVAQLGVAARVVFTGRVGHDQVGAYYALIDMLVYPRLRMRLTELVTPLKPLEAMAQGRLVLASNVGGHRELITHNKTGILFDAGSAAALAESVLALLASPWRWQGLREAARAFVESERTWSASVARYAPLYGALLERKSGR
ncbi:TIGR04063 family PEP-CTERM/XrtA system glycosyltransferase [Massilia glaciei]|uniref:Glycosyltransferase, exosortase A system-associated n=1 Tax=Massilia glaciei TaxID=1524097 RepID=A0A2U2HJS7_9BURK|nr:TIGR04063 family PEP-CTERM/XrtA system glycosyltransferase [Massilia glaciei]PWF47646.1 glycosyltransferase, exosortase A system-associated [Massilia glaciei]